MLPCCFKSTNPSPSLAGRTDELERLSLEVAEIKQGCKRGGGGMQGWEQGHVTLLGLQNVLDGFKQCHLKARYVTEKQIGEGRRKKEGDYSCRRNTAE